MTARTIPSTWAGTVPMRNSQVPGAEGRFSGTGTGEVTNGVDAQLDLVEGGNAPFEQRLPVARRYNALSVAIRQTHADRLCEVCDRSGSRGLRRVQERVGLAQAGG